MSFCAAEPRQFSTALPGVPGMGNSSQQLGNLIAILLWSIVVEQSGLHLSFAFASILFGIAALPLLPLAYGGCVRSVKTGQWCCPCFGPAAPLLKEMEVASDAPDVQSGTPVTPVA